MKCLCVANVYLQRHSGISYINSIIFYHYLMGLQSCSHAIDPIKAHTQ